MSKRSDVLELLKNDPLGLLKNTSTKRPVSHEDSILVSSFEEIQEYFEEHKREPQSDISNIIEFKLASRLHAIRKNPKKVRELMKYDFNGLLKGGEVKEVTVEDIISNDPLGLLSKTADSDIFKLRHVRPSDRIKPDFLSRRKVNKEFSRYKEMFNVLHEELESKKRRLTKYDSADLREGSFYVLNGVLLYLESINGDVDKYEYVSGKRDRFDGRTLCIFDNGTQSEMLFRSLDKAMQLDGYSIGKIENTATSKDTTEESDVLNGYIYVLKSRNASVQSIKDLYKIGYTSGLVSERIKNAKNEATYLFDDVDVVSTFRCLNIQTHGLEQKIHDFFSTVKLDVELLDRKGISYRPREWFKVDIKLMEEVIDLIISNRIDEFMYDPRINQIIKKSITSNVSFTEAL